MAAGAPRDFSPADVNLTIEKPRVWTNGKFEEATAGNTGGLSAHILWFYLPEGAFEISLWPEPTLGFQKAGVVGAKTLTFHEGGSEYRVESSSQIVPAEGLFNVYVLRDPDWGPGPGKDGFALGETREAETAGHDQTLDAASPKGFCLADAGCRDGTQSGELVDDSQNLFHGSVRRGDERAIENVGIERQFLGVTVVFKRGHDRLQSSFSGLEA